MRQSLHHLVAKAPWSDETLLEEVRKQVLPAMQKQGPVVAWIVDDTGFPKKGKHSVGVARQYCGQVGKQENCRVAVSLSVATWSSSLPISYRLYLPKEWAEDAERREEGRSTKRDSVSDQAGDRPGPDSRRRGGQCSSGNRSGRRSLWHQYEFRDGLTELELQYVVGVQSSMTVWEPGKQAIAGQAARKNGTASATVAAFAGPSTCLG
jgi:SRSO17 transposase